MNIYQRAVAEMAAKIEAELERQRDSGGYDAPYLYGGEAPDDPCIGVDGEVNILALAAACLPEETLGAATEKELRDERWDHRAGALAEIEAAGFRPELVSEAARHYRIKIDGRGWFDFWPSTGRWAQSARKGGRAGVRGKGVAPLIAALRETAA